MFELTCGIMLEEDADNEPILLKSFARRTSIGFATDSLEIEQNE